MEIKGETDIEKAVFLLREIEAFLSLNTEPDRTQTHEIRETIKDFTKHFPYCWKCGDTGLMGWLEKSSCKCQTWPVVKNNNNKTT
jgi:hypothetical protein